MHILISSNLSAEESAVDCIILEDENSIICKYIHTRVNYDKNVSFVWTEPNGEITRTKKLVIPAGHGSIYDYRYIKGRMQGTWGFKAVDGKKEFKTTFVIE
jgi:hypothetical protein